MKTLSYGRKRGSSRGELMTKYTDRTKNKEGISKEECI
jgi:hypothetical protein